MSRKLLTSSSRSVAKTEHMSTGDRVARNFSGKDGRGDQPRRTSRIPVGILPLTPSLAAALSQPPVSPDAFEEDWPPAPQGSLTLTEEQPGEDAEEDPFHSSQAFPDLPRNRPPVLAVLGLEYPAERIISQGCATALPRLRAQWSATESGPLPMSEDEVTALEFELKQAGPAWIDQWARIDAQYLHDTAAVQGLAYGVSLSVAEAAKGAAHYQRNESRRVLEAVLFDYLAGL